MPVQRSISRIVTPGPAIAGCRKVGHSFIEVIQADDFIDTDPFIRLTDDRMEIRNKEIARELGNQHAFDSLREAELIPGPTATAEEIREFARLASASFGHPVGACKMGVDELAVVDPELRVHGLLGLRVADASVMPRIITGPTNAPTHMIAGRAAKLVLG
jgi:choline dehydrogenase-like flavoprotein